ncbi:MAG TPA: universal stress protein [Polyangiaceae bacterium]|jgi:nucleotide-binding universal stress UspA family protein
MLTIKRVLVPIDFTETSDKAFDFALELAERFGASVTAMHAYEIPVIGFPDGALVATVDIATRIQESGRKGLDAAVAARASRGVPIDSVLREGPAWEEIRALAEEMPADIIVIGTHGRRGIARALLGSVAENVIRTTKVPVLTIHGPRD